MFDIRIINADAPSYSTLSLESLFNKHRDEKKVKYNVAAELRRATFTPIIATCDGIFDHEAKVYMKKLYFCPNGLNHTLKYMGGSKQECKFASFAQSAYVSEDPELIGEVQE